MLAYACDEQNISDLQVQSDGVLLQSLQESKIAFTTCMHDLMHVKLVIRGFRPLQESLICSTTCESTILVMIA